MKKLIPLSLFILLSSFATQAQVSSNECNPNLVPFVYGPFRFYKENDPKDKRPLVGRCVKVRGRINFTTQPGADGDIHLSIEPESPDPNFLKKGQTALVAELICAKPISLIAVNNAKKQCTGFKIPYSLSNEYIVANFRNRDRVEIVGLLVVDYGHNKPNGLTEIHPVSSIKKIR